MMVVHEIFFSRDGIGKGVRRGGSGERRDRRREVVREGARLEMR